MSQEANKQPLNIVLNFKFLNPETVKLLMITGLGSAKDLALGKKGAFYNTLEEFSKYWNRIDIIAPKVPSPVSNVFDNVYIHVSPWPLVFHPFWFIKKALSLHKENKFDLMTVHEFPPFYNGIAARILWHLKRIPYVLEILHIVGYPKPASFKERFYKLIFKSFIRFDAKHVKSIRVMNKNQTPEFLKKCGIPENKIQYIPALYLDLEIFKPVNAPKEYDLIFVGRLEKNKGVRLLLEAVEKLKAQILNFKMIIVGEGSLRNFLRFKIENLKLQDNVLLYGWAKDQREIAELINKSKLLIMTSYNEGGPRVVFEALACGVPALATPVGMVTDFQSSITVVDWNSQDIADKAKKLLSDSQVYAGMRLQGLAIVKQFEKKSTIKNYAEKLQSLI